jgi:hypothetical protein
MRPCAQLETGLNEGYGCIIKGLEIEWAPMAIGSSWPLLANVTSTAGSRGGTWSGGLSFGQPAAETVLRQKPGEAAGKLK